MKKLFLLISICLVFTGCNAKKEMVVKKHKVSEVEKTDVYTDDNNIPISIYKNYGSKIAKVNNYNQVIINDTDINVFQVFPSKDDEIFLKTSFPIDFYEKWKSYRDSDKCKIGFNLKYTLSSGRNISQNILVPADTMKGDYYNYIIAYLYDDYAHINDSWYSHIEDNEYNDKTFFTSIKLYANNYAHEIDSKVILTVFTYDDMDDFDDNGEYRGNNKYSIEICDPNRKC